MSKRSGVFLVFAAVYISLFVGYAWGMVGTVTESSVEPVRWTFPIAMFFILFTPFLCRLYAGREWME